MKRVRRKCLREARLTVKIFEKYFFCIDNVPPFFGGPVVSKRSRRVSGPVYLLWSEVASGVPRACGPRLVRPVRSWGSPDAYEARRAPRVPGRDYASSGPYLFGSTFVFGSLYNRRSRRWERQWRRVVRKTGPLLRHKPEGATRSGPGAPVALGR